MQTRLSYPPKITPCENKEDLAKQAARFFYQTLECVADPVVVLPTGETPKGLYKILRNDHKSLWQRLRVIQLDEFTGLKENDPHSFAAELSREILNPVHHPEELRFFFNCNANPEEEASRIRKVIGEIRNIDLIIGGIGPNGHFGYNEPNKIIENCAGIVELDDSTREGLKDRFGKTPVPTRALTLGFKTFAKAHHILLLASGEGKPLNSALNGDISPSMPASLLRGHPHFHVMADHAALGTEPAPVA